MRRYEKFIDSRKSELFKNVGGKVLEIGPGTGVNIRFLEDADSWTGIEPNPYMLDALQKELQNSTIPNNSIEVCTASDLKLDDNSIDFAIGTLVLCSVDHPDRVIGELLRVLKPGGQYLFIEHVRDPQKSFRRFIQRCFRFCWKIVAGGCRTDLDSGSLIENAGFSEVKIERFNVSAFVIPWFLAPHIGGYAVK